MDFSSIGNFPAPATLANATTAPAPSTPVSEDQRALIQAVKAIDSSALFGLENELTFVVDRASRRTIVRVVNRSTREVILQLPAENVLRMAEENKGG